MSSRSLFGACLLFFALWQANDAHAVTQITPAGRVIVGDYYEDNLNYVCTFDDDACILKFAVVPAGKQVLVKLLACSARFNSTIQVPPPEDGDIDFIRATLSVLHRKSNNLSSHDLPIRFIKRLGAATFTKYYSTRVDPELLLYGDIQQPALRLITEARPFQGRHLSGQCQIVGEITNIEAPRRYYEEIHNGVLFSPVPAGKLLTVTSVHCVLTHNMASFALAVQNSSNVVERLQELPIIRKTNPKLPDAVSTETNLLYRPGERPFLVRNGGGSTCRLVGWFTDE